MGPYHQVLKNDQTRYFAMMHESALNKSESNTKLGASDTVGTDNDLLLLYDRNVMFLNAIESTLALMEPHLSDKIE